MLMDLTPVKIDYIPGNSFIINPASINYYKKDGYDVVAKSEFNVRMAKPCKVFFTFITEDQEIRTEEIRSLICTAYGLKKIFESRAEKFLKDVENGKIHLVFRNGSLFIEE